MSLSDFFSQMAPPRKRQKRMSVADARNVLMQEETDRLIDMDKVYDDAIRLIEDDGIVFIDEVDKIRAQVSGEPNVRGIVAQEALLTLMENENVEFDVDGRAYAVNSSGVLFVAGGAFEELYESVLRRATIGQDVAPMKPIVVVSASGEVREELPFHLRDYLKYEDLFRYGMTPQFVSRFESIVVLNDLAESDLARIFVEPDRSSNLRRNLNPDGVIRRG